MNKSNRRKALSMYARYSSLVFQMIAIIGFFTFLGYKLDEKRQAKTPLATAAFSLLGVFISLYMAVRSVRKIEP